MIEPSHWTTELTSELSPIQDSSIYSSKPRSEPLSHDPSQAKFSSLKAYLCIFYIEVVDSE